MRDILRYAHNFMNSYDLYKKAETADSCKEYYIFFLFLRKDNGPPFAQYRFLWKAELI